MVEVENNNVQMSAEEYDNRLTVQGRVFTGVGWEEAAEWLLKTATLIWGNSSNSEQEKLARKLKDLSIEAKEMGQRRRAEAQSLFKEYKLDG